MKDEIVENPDSLEHVQKNLQAVKRLMDELDEAGYPTTSHILNHLRGAVVCLAASVEIQSNHVRLLHSRIDRLEEQLNKRENHE